MNVLIKGMTMPGSCFDCPFMYGRRFCTANNEIDFFNDSDYPELKGRCDGCPLVPVPPHGRLIDADALLIALSRIVTDCNLDHFNLDDKESYGEWMIHNGINVGEVKAEEAVKNASTIIPAEEGK